MEENEETPAKSKSNGKSKIKKLSFWAGLFRNFFTIIASIVSVVTLFILIRQNENTYRPDLEVSIEPPFFEIRHNGNPGSCWDIQLYDNADSVMGELSMGIVNLGMGAAKDIVIDWRFQQEEMIGTVQLGALSLPTGVTFDKKNGMLVFGSCIYQQNGNNQLDYVLPVNQAKQPVIVDFPGHFYPLWSNLLIRTIQMTADQERCVELIQLFCKRYGIVEVDVLYRDINQKQYKKRFYLHIFPRYFDLGANKIVCSMRSEKVISARENSNEGNITVLFPDRTLRTVKVD